VSEALTLARRAYFDALDDHSKAVGFLGLLILGIQPPRRPFAVPQLDLTRHPWGTSKRCASTDRSNADRHALSVLVGYLDAMPEAEEGSIGDARN
jgi:hypothetical protein